MKITTTLATSLFSVLLLNGCVQKYSEAPLATNFKTTEQKKLQSASHWQVISSDLAKSIIGKIGKQNSIYIKNINNDFKFSNAFHTLITSEFVNNGVPVSIKRMSQDTEINLKIETIKFSEDRGKFTKTAGTLTVLSAGVWAAAYANPVLTATGVAVGSDIYTWNNSKFASGLTPQYEIIVTVSAIRNNRYLANYSNVYYIDDRDSKLYNDNAKIMKLAGDE